MGRLVNGTVTDNLQNKEIEKLKKEDDVVGKKLEVVSESLDELKADLSNTIWIEYKATYDAWSIGVSSGVKGKSTNVFALAYVTLTNDTNMVIYSTQYNAENGIIQFTSPSAIKNGTKMKVMCHFF